MEPTTLHQMQPQGTVHTQDDRLSETTAETQEMQDKEHVYRDKIQQFFRAPVVEGEVPVPVKPVTLTPETPKGTAPVQGEPLFAEAPQATPAPDVAPTAPLFQQLVEEHIARGVLHPEEPSDEPTREDTATTLFSEDPVRKDTDTPLFSEKPAQEATTIPLFTEEPASVTTPPEELFISETPSTQENVIPEPLSFTSMPAFTVPTTEEEEVSSAQEAQEIGLPSPFAVEGEDVYETEAVNEQKEDTLPTEEHFDEITEITEREQMLSQQPQTLSEETKNQEPKSLEPEQILIEQNPVQQSTEPQEQPEEEQLQEPIESNFVEEALPEQKIIVQSLVTEQPKEITNEQSIEPDSLAQDIPEEALDNQEPTYTSEEEIVPPVEESESLANSTEDLLNVQENEEQITAETEPEQQPNSEFVTEPDHLDHHIRLGAWEWLYELFVGIDPQKALEKREYTAGELARAEEAFHKYVATARAESTDFEDANAEFAAFTEIFLMEELLRRMEDPLTMQDQQAVITQTLNDDFFLFQDARPIRYLLEYVIGQQTQSGQVEYTPYIDYRVTTKRPLLVFMILELIFASFPTENNAFLVSIKDEIYQDRKKYVRFSFECAAHSKIQKEYTARQQLLKNLFSTVRGRFGMRITDASIELILDLPFVVKKDEE